MSELHLKPSRVTFWVSQQISDFTLIYMTRVTIWSQSRRALSVWWQHGELAAFATSACSKLLLIRQGVRRFSQILGKQTGLPKMFGNIKIKFSIFPLFYFPPKRAQTWLQMLSDWSWNNISHTVVGILIVGSSLKRLSRRERLGKREQWNEVRTRLEEPLARLVENGGTVY